MRFKKGFTLAEILIVLMVIGALATMTVPSLIKGVQEAQYKTAYKKALNAIVNLTAMEKLAGNLPTQQSDDAADRVFDSLVSSLAIKGFAQGSKEGLGNQKVIDVKSDTIPITTTTPSGAKRYQNWIITEDNIAYLVTRGKQGDNTNCGTKLEILNTQGGATAAPTAQGAATGAVSQTADTFASNSCFVIYVDVNGLTSGPNTLATNNYVEKSAAIPTLTWDTFPIYVGADGATPGNQKVTITGRIASDLK